MITPIIPMPTMTVVTRSAIEECTNMLEMTRDSSEIVRLPNDKTAVVRCSVDRHGNVKIIISQKRKEKDGDKNAAQIAPASGG